MADSAGGDSFPELSGVIEDYAQKDPNHQVEALRVISAAYLPLFEVPPMPDAKRLVEDVLRANDFLLADPESGQLDSSAVDAVVSVATSRLDAEDLEWGAGCLMNVMDALRKRAQTGGYETYAMDADDVLDGLETILAADIMEDAIEDILEGEASGLAAGVRRTPGLRGALGAAEHLAKLPHLIFQELQALLDKGELVGDLLPGSLARPLAASQKPAREASAREPRGGAGKPRTDPGSIRQAARVVPDGAPVEAAPFPARASSPSTLRTPAHTLPHAILRPPFGFLAPAPSAYVSLLRPLYDAPHDRVSCTRGRLLHNPQTLRPGWSVRVPLEGRDPHNVASPRAPRVLRRPLNGGRRL